MSGANGDGPVRDALREVLRELLPELLGAERPAAGGLEPAGTSEAVAQAVPQVPPPPVAAVHRPSTWATPPAAAAQEQAPAPRPPAPVAAPSGTDVEEVALDTDADLQAFVLRLVRLCDNPRDRQRLRAGKLRFAMRPRAGAAAAATGPSVRVERGAVTERVVADAAAQGARLVLGPRAVLTPMGRDRARALGVEIERERRC